MAQKNQFTDSIDSAQSVVIASGQQVSGALDCEGMCLVGFITPATLTGTSFTFQVSDSLAGTYRDLYDQSNSLYTVTVAANRAYILPATDLVAFRYIKIKSSASEGADRTIYLVLRAL